VADLPLCTETAYNETHDPRRYVADDGLVYNITNRLTGASGGCAAGAAASN
jgi:hypothetical protein